MDYDVIDNYVRTMIYKYKEYVDMIYQKKNQLLKK